MPNALQVMPGPSVFPRNSQPRVTTGLGGSSCNEIPSSKMQVTQAHDEVAQDSHDENGENHVLTINDIESLKEGIINIPASKANAPYTILLLGETGVGKSTLLELFANVLNGKDIDHYDFDILDHTNENGGSTNQSRTNSVRLYEFTSKNGIAVRILDSPGLADTQQDELLKKNIATQITQHTDSFTAVLVLANGTVPRGTASLHYALSTLSILLPNTPANNIGFVFTNASGPLYVNIPDGAVPDALNDAPRFLLNNPVALQRQYLKLMSSPNMRKRSAEMRKEVRACEEDASEMLVELFNWLDGLEPQRTTVAVSPYVKTRASEARITSILAQVVQAATKQEEIDKEARECLGPTADMGALANVENSAVDVPVWKQQPASSLNYLCTAPDCYSICHSSTCLAPIWRLLRLRCGECAHSHLSHYHTHHVWVQGIDAQAFVDNGTMEKWKTIMDDLERPLEDYAGQSLPGGFSAHVEKVIRLLEESYKDMEKKGFSKAQLEKTQGSVDVMKRKLELLKEAKENMRKERAKKRFWW